MFPLIFVFLMALLNHLTVVLYIVNTFNFGLDLLKESLAPEVLGFCILRAQGLCSRTKMFLIPLNLVLDIRGGLGGPPRHPALCVQSSTFSPQLSQGVQG